MGSVWDLGNDNVKLFNELVDVIKSKKGNCSPFEQALLVNYFKEHGYERMHLAIFAAMSHNWFYPAQWYRLACLIKRHGESDFNWALERMEGRENHSIDTLEGILLREIPAYRKAVVTTTNQPPAGIRKKPRYPSEDGKHTEATARSWLLTNGKRLEQLLEFFELAGKDKELNCPLLQLKSEYK